jgi:hypothetical protein
MSIRPKIAIASKLPKYRKSAANTYKTIRQLVRAAWSSRRNPIERPLPG